MPSHIGENAGTMIKQVSRPSGYEQLNNFHDVVTFKRFALLTKNSESTFGVREIR